MTYQITPASAAVSENAGAITFTITRSDGLLAETLYLSTAPILGFSNAGDYQGLRNLPLSFAAGELSRTVNLKVLNDTAVEPAESFAIILQRLATDPVGTFLAKSKFTILDDDAPPATIYGLAPAAPSVGEASGTLSFTVTRNGQLAAETLYVSTTPNLGFSNSGDYAGLRNRAISFAEGQATALVSIAIFDDTIAEPSERFGLIVQRFASDPASTYLARTTFTILDNDQAPATSYAISPATMRVHESAGVLTFTVSRSGPLAAETLYASTAPGAGFVNAGDYTELTGIPVVFALGQSTATVTLAIADDRKLELTESLDLLLQRQAADPITKFLAKAGVTIVDDDAGVDGAVALTLYPVTGIDGIAQGNRDNDDSHAPGGARQWAYDFLAPLGSEVHAVAAGEVVAVRQDFTGAMRGYGNVVTILHDGGFYATYAHLAAFSSALAVGDIVAAGQVIARSGDSGTLWDGLLHPHLHLQLGTRASLLAAKFGDSSTNTLIANGSQTTEAPAYFPKLVIDFANRGDLDLSTDTDYFGAAGIDDFTGNALANTVFGAKGNDILRGEAGNDSLQGGVGQDVLTGGTGQDRFVYAGADEAGDTITDFSAVDDTLVFFGAAFGNLAPGPLAQGQFAVQATGIAATAELRFLFAAASAKLWFDADGAGGAAPILIATLQPGAMLTAGDILIV